MPSEIRAGAGDARPQLRLIQRFAGREAARPVGRTRKYANLAASARPSIAKENKWTKIRHER
jgi:hypothetical protein